MLLLKKSLLLGLLASRAESLQFGNNIRTHHHELKGVASHLLEIEQVDILLYLVQS